MRAGCALLVLLWAIVAQAGEVIIAGPSSVPAPGYPCTLYLQGQLPEGTVVGWDVTPKRKDLDVQLVTPAKDGMSVVLATLSGTWTVTAAVHVPDKPIVFWYHIVSVPGTPYIPPGTPQPPTTPTIPIPGQPPIITPPITPPADPPDLQGLFGLAPKVRDAVNQLVHPSYQHHAAGLAKVYHEAADKVISGEINRSNAAKKIGEMNGTVLTTKEDRAAWKPFLDWLGDEMIKLTLAGKITTNKLVTVAIAEISLGLSLVAAQSVEDTDYE